MVTTFYPPYHFGGDGVYVYRLAEELAARGHRVDVVHSVDAYRLQHPSEPEVAFAHHPNVTRYPLASGRPRVAALVAHQLGRPGYYAPTLREVLSGGRYDVIHYHNVSLMGAPEVLRLGRAVKLYTAHDYWLLCPTHVLFAFNSRACTARRCLACTLHARRPPQGWRYTSLLEQCVRHVDCFLMPSRFALERHQAELDRPTVLLPCFVPGPVPEGAGLPPFAAMSHRPFFLYVGRLEKLKGVQDLLRLFREYQGADLVVVGTGSYASVLHEQARGLPHVRFLGPVHPEALGALYREAVGVVVPSLCYETFGLTAAEALAHGTPVVVRRIGALTEIAAQGRGLTFDSLSECREAMDRLLTQPDLRASLGVRGRDAARRIWSTEAHLGQYLDLVASLMERQAIGAADPSLGALAAPGSGELVAQ
jgi:glycosyltransferase involved in cell wall biosynthesis